MFRGPEKKVDSAKVDKAGSNTFVRLTRYLLGIALSKKKGDREGGEINRPSDLPLSLFDEPTRNDCSDTSILTYCTPPYKIITALVLTYQVY